jgi:MFS family permease
VTRRERVERNLRLYPVYQILRNAFFWLPIFFLYFLSVLSLEEALLLEAIYYVAAVALEVPSGYLADRLGRRPTLILAMLADVGAAVVFAATGAFAPFVAAQVLKAAGHAFNSGADSALLFDSLRELEREPEIGLREARAFSAGLGATAIAALVGGLSAGIDLRIAWLLTALTSVGGLVIALRFQEPERGGEGQGVSQAVAGVGRRLRDKHLRWIFVFVVGMVVLNHVPYEFFQPYVALLVGASDRGYSFTPAVTGVLAAAMALGGAVASRGAMRVRSAIGVKASLLTAMALQLAIIASMAVTLAPWVLVLVLLRSTPMGLLNPIMLAEVHPRVETQIRATYLSLQSFAGRLAFAACLAVSSQAVAGLETSHPAMARVLWVYLAGGLLLGAALVWTGRRPHPDPELYDDQEG